MGEILDRFQKNAPAEPARLREKAEKAMSSDVINLRDDLEDAAKEVLLHKGGKVRLQRLDEFLDEV
ncbi:hypothetical protein [Dyadobacter sp. 32]|uniref:hypothetical protein n=1 Tax=Dyadobacter sp. 32 TaxID=538966 RepID=UPI0011ED7541